MSWRVSRALSWNSSHLQSGQDEVSGLPASGCARRIGKTGKAPFWTEIRRSKVRKRARRGWMVDRDYEPGGCSQTRPKLRPGVSWERPATLKECFFTDLRSDLEGRFGSGLPKIEISQRIREIPASRCAVARLVALRQLATTAGPPWKTLRPRSKVLAAGNCGETRGI